MNSSDILALLGRPLSDPDVQAMLGALGTYRRPSLSREDDRMFYDWVLVKRKGVELGFSDSEYHRAGKEIAWGKGDLLLTQSYFYSLLDDGLPFPGQLPYQLSFQSDRQTCREKLLQYEESRHSYLSDTWDTGNYRLTVAYGDNGLVDKVACRVIPAPIPRHSLPTPPSLASIVEAFGDSISSTDFQRLWGESLDRQALEQARDDGQIDFTQSFGATLGLSDSRELAFRSIVLHRNRDQESVGWSGELPQHLTFEDSPEALFTKMGPPDVKGTDSALTGYAVWHFSALSVHVLYSNVDNRLLRVKLMAPGTWKSVRDT